MHVFSTHSCCYVEYVLTICTCEHVFLFLLGYVFFIRRGIGVPIAQIIDVRQVGLIMTTRSVPFVSRQERS